MRIHVDRPKEVHAEIRTLMAEFYRSQPESFFVTHYPELYHLYFEISAHAEEFDIDLTPKK